MPVISKQNRGALIAVAGAIFVSGGLFWVLGAETKPAVAPVSETKLDVVPAGEISSFVASDTAHVVETKPIVVPESETKLEVLTAGETSGFVASDTANVEEWKIYRNDYWGFSFKYPQGVEVKEVDGPYEIHVFIRLDNYLKISNNEKTELRKYFPSGAFAEGASPVVVTMEVKERVQPNPAHKDVEAVMHDEPGDAFTGYEYGSKSKINPNYKVRFQGLPAVQLMINNINQGFSGTVSYFALHPNNDQLRVEAHLSVPFKDVPENIEFPSWYSYFEKSLPLQDTIMKSIDYFPPKKNIQKAVDQLN